MEVFTVLAGAGDCFIRHAVSGGRPGGGFRPSAAPRRRAPPAERAGDTILGRAFVTDGGGVRVAGREIRIAGLDAAEPDREATRRDGDRSGHGKRARSALIREIGGEQVRVSVEGRDAFGRLLGSVTRDGRDIGEWLVRKGHASAGGGGRYERAEREAREAGRGMWAQARELGPGARPRLAEERLTPEARQTRSPASTPSASAIAARVRSEPARLPVSICDR